MANTYDTSGEPLGSTAPKVLYNNASNLDDAVNSEMPTWQDRPPFNRTRKTFWGMEQDFNDFLINSGFEPVHLTYVDGVPLQVDRPTQLIDRAGFVYRVKMPQTFPFTLTGTWATDQNFVVDVSDQALRQDLASATGSTMVGRPVGTVGQALDTLEKHAAEKVYLTDYANPADADCTAGVLAAIAYAQTLPVVDFIIPVGEFKISDWVTFDLPDFSTLSMYGSFKCLAGGHVRIGSEVRNTFGYNVSGIDVYKDGFSTGAANVGVHINNVAFSEIQIKRVKGFQTGVFVTGTQPNGGVSYNQFWMGLIHDNQYNLFLTASGSGYTNENVFYGGSFNHSSGYPGVVEIANIFVQDYVTHPLNNNRFMFPSLEDNRADAIGARIEGVNNILIQPRIENPANLTGYGVFLPTNSQSCRVQGGYGMRNGNVVDNGLYNIVETLDGIKFGAQGATPIIALRNFASSNNKVFIIRDAVGTETLAMFGTGDISAKGVGCTILNIGTPAVFADNAAALAGGLPPGRIYRTPTGQAMVVY